MAFRSTPNRQKNISHVPRVACCKSVCSSSDVVRVPMQYTVRIRFVLLLLCAIQSSRDRFFASSTPPFPPLLYILQRCPSGGKKKTQLRLSLLPCKKRAEERRWVSHYEKYIFRNGMKKGFRSVRSPSLLSPPPSREYWDFSFLLPGEIHISLISFFLFRPPFFYT